MHRALPDILEPLDELERRLSHCRDAYQKPRLHLLVLLARVRSVGARMRRNAWRIIGTPSVSGCESMRKAVWKRCCVPRTGCPARYPQARAGGTGAFSRALCRMSRD